MFELIFSASAFVLGWVFHQRLIGIPEKNEPKTINYCDDIKLDREIQINEDRNNKFASIVGENPLEQIDWIIENGLIKYNDTYNQVMNGEYVEKINDIYFPFTHSDKPYSKEVGYVRGGIGNKILASWEYETVFREDGSKYTIKER